MNVYKITNTVNGKVYIGQTIQKNPRMRWYDHCSRSRNGQNNHLYNSMRKYGIDNFKWEVIDSATTIKELNDKEEYWLNYFKQVTECYNIRKAGGNKTHNPESIEKMRSSQKAAHARRRSIGTDTWTRRDGGAMKGKSHPRKGVSGKWSMSDEAKKKISRARQISNGTRGKTWKLVDGRRVYMNKEN